MHPFDKTEKKSYLPSLKVTFVNHDFKNQNCLENSLDIHTWVY